MSQLKDELNVKEVDLSETDAARFAVREIKLNFPVLGKKYGAQMKELAARVRALQGAGREAGPAVKAGAGERPAPLVPDGEGRLKVDGFVLTADEYEIVYAPKCDYSVANDLYTLIAFDTCVTDELRLEGWAREVIRRVQDLRKQAGYQVDDRIRVFYEVVDARGQGDCGPFARHGEYIKNETLATELAAGRPAEVDTHAEVALDQGPRVWVGVRKA
jgi:isoleucyl-tRNA synthetase